MCCFKLIKYIEHAQVHGYLTSYAFQCVLPINLYNDKFYAMIALAFAFVFCVTMFNFWGWVFALTIQNSRWVEEMDWVILSAQFPNEQLHCS